MSGLDMELASGIAAFEAKDKSLTLIEKAG